MGRADAGESSGSGLPQIFRSFKMPPRGQLENPALLNKPHRKYKPEVVEARFAKNLGMPEEVSPGLTCGARALCPES